MTSIAPKKPFEIARDVAFELRLPWRVEQLRVIALEANPTAKHRAEKSGLSRKQADERVRQLIYGEVSKFGKEMDALPPGEERVTPEQIETALEAFTSVEWRSLVKDFALEEADTVCSYVDDNRRRLIGTFGSGKVYAVIGATARRGTELWLGEKRSKLVPISDPYLALVLRDLAREVNCKGKGHSAKGRSVDELTSDRALARRLTKRDEQTGREMKVSPYQVKQWRERMEELSFEQYAAEVGADDEEKRAAAFIDYLTMIRKKPQRKN